jgi:predicted alpha/beta superfamily hydrolase
VYVFCTFIFSANMATSELPPSPRREGELHFHLDFPSTFLDNRRTLVVYLPPGYGKERRRRYPVLYLHDGQNLFDPATAAFGVAWDADRTAERLMRAGLIPPLLMVGIYNTPDRFDEYTVHADAQMKAGGKGSLYGRFVMDEVKPFIERNYRTRPDRDHTAVAGSSLGGLISLAIARDHWERFALCGILSPALWWARCPLLREMSRDQTWMQHMRFWLDMGTRQGPGSRRPTTGIRHIRRLAGYVKDAGLVAGRDYACWEVEGGEHNEAHWAARFDRVLLYFFGNRT